MPTMPPRSAARVGPRAAIPPTRRCHQGWTVGCSIAFLVMLGSVGANAATLPEGFRERVLAGTFHRPTALAFAPDGRVFVTEQDGTLRIVKNGVLLAAPFLDLTVDSGGERGLLGVAIHPRFGRQPYVYVTYTLPSTPPRNRVSRFTVAGDTAVPGSERVILELDDLSTKRNHNGGALHFGRDGHLYIAVGDNAEPTNAQSLATLHGKILRVDPRGIVPLDNPFVGVTTGKHRAIWALGLRNPFSFAVQRGTGTIHINDVGFHTFEEINLGVAGANYGWPDSEGPTGNPAHTSPLFAYEHGISDSTGCAITGGGFYSPRIRRFPAAFTDSYFFADFCSGWIRRRDAPTGVVDNFASGIENPVALAVSTDGYLYYLAGGRAGATGILARIRYRAP